MKIMWLTLLSKVALGLGGGKGICGGPPTIPWHAVKITSRANPLRAKLFLEHFLLGLDFVSDTRTAIWCFARWMCRSMPVLAEAASYRKSIAGPASREMIPPSNLIPAQDTGFDRIETYVVPTGGSISPGLCPDPLSGAGDLRG
jgi:hypothetical protein